MACATLANEARALALAAALVGCSANDDIPAPLLSTVIPDHAPVGAIVMVAGAYFCQRPGTNEDPICDVVGTVHFAAAPGTPSQWTDTMIMVEVPQGVSGRADVTVTAAGRTSNTVAFTAE